MIFQKQKSFGERIQDILTILLYISFITFSTNIMGVYYMIGLTIAIYLIHLVTNGFNIHFHFGIYHYYILTIGIFCLFSSLWADVPSYAIEKGITLLELLIIFSLLYSVYYGCDSERLLICIKWAGFLLALYTIGFVGLSNLEDIVGEEGRLENSFANVNTIGMCCSTSVLIAFFFGRLKRNIIDIFMCIPTLYIIAASGSRKALVMLIFGILFIIFYQYKESNSTSFQNKLFNVLGTLFILGILAVILLKLGIFGGSLSRMEGMIASITGNGEVDSSTIIRSYYRYLGLEQFLKTPFLGIGMGNPRLLAFQYTGHDCYLHCNYAEIAAGGGLVGLIVVYWIYIKLGQVELKNLKVNKYASIMLLLIVLNLILDYGLVSYYDKGTYFIFMILCLHYESLRQNHCNY